MKKGFLIGLVILGLVAGFACKSSTTPPAKELPTINSFTATPSTIDRGASSTLAWDVSDASSVSINQGIGSVSTKTGTTSVSPTDTTTYTLTATNDDGNKTATCTVTVELNLPTIDYFLATPASTKLDDPSTLSWSVQDATTITIDHGIGSVTATGTTQVTPQETTTYTMTAVNADGQATATCQVEILPMAELGIDIDYGSVSILYDSGSDTTAFSFTAILTESNGVGGTVEFLATATYLDDTYLGSWEFGVGDFAPYGTFTQLCDFTSPGQPNYMLLYSSGTDDNGYPFEAYKEYTITWGSPKGAAVQPLKTIDPNSADARIRSLKGHRRIKRQIVVPRISAVGGRTVVSILETSSSFVERIL